MPPGTVVWLQRTPFRGASCVPEELAVLRADWGLDGDRHARPASSRQVVLVAAEVLDELGLPHGATREQLTLAGLPDLAAGDRLTIGDAVVELVRPRVPCRVMEGVRVGLEDELRGRGGWCGRVLSTGVVRRGDPVARQRAGTCATEDPPWLRRYLEAVTSWEESPPIPAGRDGRTFAERLAHLIAGDERAVHRIRAAAEAEQAGAAPAEPVAKVDVCRAAGALPGGAPATDLWARHDLGSTAVVDVARRHPRHAEPWVRALTAHYREHS